MTEMSQTDVTSDDLLLGSDHDGNVIVQLHVCVGGGRHARWFRPKMRQRRAQDS